MSCQPDSNTQCIDGSDPSFTHTGDWQVQGTSIVSSSAGDTGIFIFEGTLFMIIRTFNSLQVLIDPGQEIVVGGQSSDGFDYSLDGRMFFSLPDEEPPLIPAFDFDPGEHTVSIENNRGGQITIDFFEVKATLADSTPPVSTPTLTCVCPSTATALAARDVLGGVTLTPTPVTVSSLYLP